MIDGSTKKELIYRLEKINFPVNQIDKNWTANLLSHIDSDIRSLALKTVGKFREDILIEQVVEIAKKDKDTNVRREAVSVLGRQRKISNKKTLLLFLNDSDPKIVCQAIRALLVFKGDKEVDLQLKKMISHPNEMVQYVIEKEFFSKNDFKKINDINHKDTYPYLTNTIVNGDVLEILKKIKEESFHLTFTSPPYYNARDYSIYQSYEEYINFLESVFKEVYRTTKEGRFLIVNTSPVIVPRVSRAHSSKRYPIPFDLHSVLVKNGWEFIDDIVWEKPEYSVKNRVGGFQQHRKPLAYKPNSVTEYLMVYRKKTNKLIDWNIHQYDFNIVKKSKVKDGFETSNVWKINPKSDKIHSAVFPVELCKRVVEYYSFVNDIIFDPFAGSGTLGRTAKSLGRKFFLTEKEVKYFEYMKTFLKEESDTKFLTLTEFLKLIK